MLGSAAQARKECKRILIDGDVDASQDFLMRLVRHHPRSEKTRGVRRVVSNASVGGKGDGFCLEFQDGRVESVSYKKCCTSIRSGTGAASAAQNRRVANGDLQEAMRNEVLDQTRTHRLAAGCGGQGAEMHVGHGSGEAAFCKIARSFLATLKEPVALEKRAQRGHHAYTVYYFKDVALAARWRSFHQERASLKMQTREENLRERL